MRFEVRFLNFFSMRNEVRTSTKSKRGQMSAYITNGVKLGVATVANAPPLESLYVQNVCSMVKKCSI